MDTASRIKYIGRLAACCAVSDKLCMPQRLFHAAHVRTVQKNRVVCPVEIIFHLLNQYQSSQKYVLLWWLQKRESTSEKNESISEEKRERYPRLRGNCEQTKSLAGAPRKPSLTHFNNRVTVYSSRTQACACHQPT